MLRDLLEISEKRKLEIMECMTERADWVTLKELAEYTGYSENVLKKDISLLKQDETFGHWVTSHKGVYFQLPENNNIDCIYRQMLKRSTAFQLLERLLFEKETQIPELAEQLYISPSTLTRLIKRMNEVLEDTTFQIEMNPCRITGNEGTVRNFYTHYFYECYSPLEWPFLEMNQNRIDQLFSTVTKLLHIDLDYADYTRVKHWIIIAYYRAENGHHVTVKPSAFVDKIYSILSKQPIKLVVEKTLKIKVTKEIIEQLLATFTNSKYVPNYENLQNSALEDEAIQMTIDLLDRSLDELSDTLDVPIFNKEQMVLDLYNIINLLELLNKGNITSAGSILFSQKQLFIKQMKREYPTYTKTALDKVDKIIEKSGKQFNQKGKNEVFYILTIGWKELIPTLISREEKVSIVIISRYDIEHAEMIEDVIHQQFKGTIETKIYDKMQLNERILGNLKEDLIITTFSMGEHATKPSVVINSYPTKKDLQLVHQRIDEVKQRKVVKVKNKLLTH